MAKLLVRKNLSIAIISLLALGLVGAAAYVKVNQPKSPPAHDNQEHSISEADPSGDRAARGEDPAQSGNGQSTPPPASQPSSGQPPTAKKQITPVVTTFGQNPDKTTVLIRAYTEESSPGSCVVSFKKAGSPPLERTAQTLLQGDVQRCQGFDIPTTQFPAKGEWSFTVRIASDSYEGASSAQIINVQ